MYLNKYSRIVANMHVQNEKPNKSIPTKTRAEECPQTWVSIVQNNIPKIKKKLKNGLNTHTEKNIWMHNTIDTKHSFGFVIAETRLHKWVKVSERDRETY